MKTETKKITFSKCDPADDIETKENVIALLEALMVTVTF